RPHACGGSPRPSEDPTRTGAPSRLKCNDNVRTDQATFGYLSSAHNARDQLRVETGAHLARPLSGRCGAEPRQQGACPADPSAASRCWTAPARLSKSPSSSCEAPSVSSAGRIRSSGLAEKSDDPSIAALSPRT